MPRECAIRPGMPLAEPIVLGTLQQILEVAHLSPRPGRTTDTTGEGSCSITVVLLGLVGCGRTPPQP